MMIIVEYGIGKGRCHVSYLFCLSYKIKCAMLYKLKNVRHSVRTVQVNISLFLAHESLIALRTEEFPCAYEILDHTDIGTCLDVEVASIKETTYIESRNEFIRLILGIGTLTL